MLAPFVVAGILGAFVGSFLGVCVHRLPRNEGLVRPGSRCYACGTRVRWYDNLPILSYLLLRGRCRWCGGRFGPGSWLLEVAVAFLTGLVAWYAFRGPATVVAPYLPASAWGRGLAATVLLVFAWAAVVAAVIDLTWLIIPDEISKPLLVAAPLLVLGTGIHRQLGWDVAAWFVTPYRPWSAGAGLVRLWAVAAPALALLPASLLLARGVYRRCRRAGEHWEEEDFRGLRVGVLFYLAEAVLLLLAVSLAVILAGPWPSLRGVALSLAQGLLGSLAAWWLLWGIGLGGTILFARNAMGYGDVKFFACFGFLLGPAGVAVAFVGAALCACCISLPVRLFSRERELPFGPYLVLGTALTVVWGRDALRLLGSVLR